MIYGYFIVGAIVVVAVVWQICSFNTVWQRIQSLRVLFPEDDDGYYVHTDENGQATGIGSTASGAITPTIESINKYIANNSTKTFDYQIIKEIVEREALSLQEEVDTLLSAPLYVGLMATIVGIAGSVLLIVLGGDAEAITVSSEGMRMLLCDVAIAMCASFCGVLCTKIATAQYNTARSSMDSAKNRFLTWIQATLMPKSNDSVAGVLTMLVQNLSTFNNTFSANTKELRATLAVVNSNYDEQVEILNAIRNLDITKIAKANITVYAKLKDCSDEIGRLAELLAQTDDYLTQVVALNDNLGSIDERTHLFENLGEYFMREHEHIFARQGAMQQHMASLDAALQQALTDLGTSTVASMQHLTTTYQQQTQALETQLTAQQETLAQQIASLNAAQQQHLAALTTSTTASVQQFSDTLQQQQQALAALLTAQQETLLNHLVAQQEAVRQQIAQMDDPFRGVQEVFDKGVQSLTAAFDKQNAAITEGMQQQQQALGALLTAQQETLLNHLVAQQETARQQIAQMDDPFRGVQEVFDKGVQSLTAAFDKQNAAIAEGMQQQQTLLETALAEQRKALLEKMQETPAQQGNTAPLSPEALDKIATTLQDISKKLEEKKGGILDRVFGR